MKGFGNQDKVPKKPKTSKNKTNPSKDKIIDQAFKYHSKGNISEASKYYEYFINQGFNDCRVFSNYGLIMQNIGKLKDAEKLYRKAIAINPDYARAYSNLGNVLRDLGKLKDAEESYRKAIAINPYLAIAYSNLGNVLRDLGNLKDAEESTRKAIAINPDYAEAYCNLGMILQDLSHLQEAEKSYRKAIAINPDSAVAYSNLGNVLRDLSHLQEAEESYRKAIKINPDYAKAYSNLGGVLSNLGNLKEAEEAFQKAIKINPNYERPYYLLSLMKYSEKHNSWLEKLFSENILIKKSKKEQIDIYFARANILHKEKKYKESSKYLVLANKLKLTLKPSEPNNLIEKSKILLIETNKEVIKKKDSKNYNESIFIVGMPRSGSTLLESILSMRDDVYDLGEVNFLEESFINFKNSKQDINLSELYRQRVNKETQLNITIDKNLYNYQYTGIISNQIPNAKIIHCFRNPLDNILSLYRANFSTGNEYSSSIVDSAKIYLNQEKTMSNYKQMFQSKIYSLNYDSLVINPTQEIKSLISWLCWKWDDSYLLPHLNPRSVSTASNVQVRSPINSQSIGGWKNYRELLKPGIEIISQIDRYRNLIF